MQDIVAIAEAFRASMIELGINVEFVAKAKSGSCYLMFDDPNMGKVRFGDHPERERYGYKWQIRTDITEAYIDEDKNYRRFFFPAHDIEAAITCMRRRMRILEMMDRQ